MTVGERIKQRRLDLGLTQEELANKLGNKSRASVCTVEKDKEDLTTTRLKQYAEALGVTPAYLAGWEDINGNPIPSEPSDIKPQITDYRVEFVEESIAFYQQVQSLPPELRTQLESYLRYLKSQS